MSPGPFDKDCIFCDTKHNSIRTVELVFGKTKDLMPVTGGKIMKDHCCNHAFMIEELRRSWKVAGLQTAIEEGFLGRPFVNQEELDKWWKDPVTLIWRPGYGPGYQVNNAFVVFLALLIPEADGGLLGMSSERRKMWV
jgi:hypothetical protein